MHVEASVKGGWTWLCSVRSSMAGVVRACVLLVPMGFPLVAHGLDGGRTSASSGVSAQNEDPVLDTAQQQIAAARFHDAIATLEREIHADEGENPRRLASRLGTLGIALTLAGAHGEAVEVQHRALALYEALGDQAGASAITTNLGASLNALGDTAGARRYFEDALALKQRHGIDRGVGTIYNNLAELSENEGNPEAARDLLERALAAHAKAADARGESMARSNLARVLAKLGQHEAAMEQIRIAETLARAKDYQVGVLVAQAAHAFVLMARLRTDTLVESERKVLLAQADASLHQALAVSRAQQDRDRSIRLLDGLSELRQMQGLPEEALTLLQQSRGLEEEQRRSASLARTGLLSARYDHERQQREIDRLKVLELHNAKRVLRQRQGLWVLASLLLMALAGSLALVWTNRKRRAAAHQMQRHNEALSIALDQAQHERQRTEAYALRQRRFLRLASEDLRDPLREMRTLAERALVEDNPDSLRRSHAAIAQNAADLIWVTDQMLESAEHDPADMHTSRQAEATDLVALLRALVDEAVPRAQHRDQHVTVQCTLVSAFVRIERVRCQVALRELIDILLFLNPARVRLGFTLDERDGDARIRLDAGVARLPDWRDIALGQEHGDVTLRLALAWIQHAIQDNDGYIATEREPGENRREIVIRFPLVAATIA